MTSLDGYIKGVVRQLQRRLNPRAWFTRVSEKQRKRLTAQVWERALPDQGPNDDNDRATKTRSRCGVAKLSTRSMSTAEVRISASPFVASAGTCGTPRNAGRVAANDDPRPGPPALRTQVWPAAVLPPPA
jgi:hypothetical protein